MAGPGQPHLTDKPPPFRLRHSFCDMLGCHGVAAGIRVDHRRPSSEAGATGCRCGRSALSRGFSMLGYSSYRLCDDGCMVV